MPTMHINMDQAMEIAVKHHQAGQFTEAEGLYRQVVSLNPNHANALHLLGVAAAQQGRHAEAAELIQRAIAIDPSVVVYYTNLANALRESGQFDDALAAAKKAAELTPDSPDVHHSVGAILKDMGRYDQSIKALCLALRLKPKFPEACNDLGLSLAGEKRYDEAIKAYRQALRLNPDYAVAHNNIGIAFSELKKLDEAVAEYEIALRLTPNSHEAYNNLGNALGKQRKFAEAIDAYHRAIELNPRHAELRRNLGLALMETKQFKEAVAEYEKAIELEPDSAEAHWNLANILLLQGDFERGWAEYEWRWRWKDFPSPRRIFVQPLWTGQPIHGRTILLHGEQGFGDTMQFIRYVPLVAARGARVTVACQPDIARLLSRVTGVVEVVTGDELPACEFHCPLLSLPQAFGTRLNTIPAYVPYLKTESALVKEWAQRLGPSDGRLRVGLAWAGRAAHTNDRNRSMPFAKLLPLAAAKYVTFFNLQKGPASAEAEQRPPEMPWVDLTADLHDFAETAALVSLVDLVIAVDTSMVHLAGGLGKPVWVMLPFRPDWRWLLDRDDSPWYPTARLFRQSEEADWDGVVQRVSEALGSFGK